MTRYVQCRRDCHRLGFGTLLKTNALPHRSIAHPSKKPNLRNVQLCHSSENRRSSKPFASYARSSIPVLKFPNRSAPSLIQNILPYQAMCRTSLASKRRSPCPKRLARATGPNFRTNLLVIRSELVLVHPSSSGSRNFGMRRPDPSAWSEMKNECTPRDPWERPQHLPHSVVHALSEYNSTAVLPTPPELGWPHCPRKH